MCLLIEGQIDMKLKHIALILALALVPCLHGILQPQIGDASGDRVLLTGSATLANTKLSLANSYAFFDMADTSITPFIGQTIEICNTSARSNCIRGVIGTSGTGETFGSELSGAWTNIAGTPWSTFTPGSGSDVTEASNLSAPDWSVASRAATSLKYGLYRIAWNIVVASGYGPLVEWGTGAGDGNPIQNFLAQGLSNSNSVIYRTLNNTYTHLALTGFTSKKGDWSLSGYSVTQVTAPSSTGYWIRSTASSADGSAWFRKDASFDPNSSGGFVWRVISTNTVGIVKASGTVTSGNVHSVVTDGNASITITGTDLSPYAGNGTGGTITMINPHSTTGAAWTINPYLIVLEDNAGKIAIGICGDVYNTTGLKLYSTPNGTTQNMKSVAAGFDVASVVKWRVYKQY
jgi:hypothetical protein